MPKSLFALEPHQTTRVDGVRTTVWRRAQKILNNRIGKVAAKPPVQQSLPSPSNAYDRALDFEVGLGDTTPPKWWDDYISRLQSDPDPAYRTTPEILDRIETARGPAVVAWLPINADSKTARVSGSESETLYIFDEETSQVLGYVLLNCMTEKSIARSFGEDEFADFRFRRRYSGVDYTGIGHLWNPPDSIEDGDAEYVDALPAEELRRVVWAAGRADFRGKGIIDKDDKYIPNYSLLPKHAPDDKTIRKEMEVWRKEIQKDKEGMLESYSYETPFVDFVRVDDSMWGQGIGKAMYIYAAKRLGTEGRMLQASSVQTDFGEDLWKSLIKNHPESIKTVMLPRGLEQKPTPVHHLDFR